MSATITFFSLHVYVLKVMMNILPTGGVFLFTHIVQLTVIITLYRVLNVIFIQNNTAYVNSNAPHVGNILHLYSSSNYMYVRCWYYYRIE